LYILSWIEENGCINIKNYTEKEKRYYMEVMELLGYLLYFQYKMIEAILYQKNELIKHISYLICFFITLSLLFEIYKVFSALFGPNIPTYFQAGNYEGVRLMLLQLSHFMLIMGIFLISSKNYENELEIQSMTDSLTGLFNRKAFDKLANMQIAKAERDNKKIGLVICDIDHFKRVNDFYGHSAGDEVLTKFSNLIKDNLRTSDLLGRFGGEEFIIIIPGIEIPEMTLKLNDIRNKIEKNIFKINGEKIHITASFGAVLFSPSDMDMKKAFNIADNALYEAKNSGRNKVIVKPLDFTFYANNISN
jgi:diguanylate cyclase (GGDEF)-like protein